MELPKQSNWSTSHLWRVWASWAQGRLWGCLKAAPLYLWGEHLGDTARLFTVGRSRRTRDNMHKLKQERFRWHVKEKLFQPEDTQARWPSLCLWRVSKSQMDKILGSLFDFRATPALIRELD